MRTRKMLLTCTVATITAAMLGGIAAAGSARATKGDAQAVFDERDQARDSGEKALEQTLSLLSRRAESLDDYWRRFRQSCYEGRVGGAFDHEWFAVFDTRAMSGAVSPRQS